MSNISRHSKKTGNDIRPPAPVDITISARKDAEREAMQKFINEKPDYEYASKQPCWVIEEAVALLNDMQPARSIPLPGVLSIPQIMRIFRSHNDMPYASRANDYVKFYDLARRDSQHIGEDFNKKTPAQWISWAKQKEFTVPEKLERAVIKYQDAPNKRTNIPKLPTEKPSYCTQDMELLFDAVNKFWADYDLTNPNPSVAPMKKEVTAWLIQEAKKRNIADFTLSRAKAMDTIMRCPVARAGGNTR